VWVVAVVLKRPFCSSYLTGEARVILALYYCRCCDLLDIVRFTCLERDEAVELLAELMTSGTVRRCMGEKFGLTGSGEVAARKILGDMRLVLLLLRGRVRGLEEEGI